MLKLSTTIDLLFDKLYFKLLNKLSRMIHLSYFNMWFNNVHVYIILQHALFIINQPKYRIKMLWYLFYLERFFFFDLMQPFDLNVMRHLAINNACTLEIKCKKTTRKYTSTAIEYLLWKPGGLVRCYVHATQLLDMLSRLDQYQVLTKLGRVEMISEKGWCVIIIYFYFSLSPNNKKWKCITTNGNKTDNINNSSILF